MCPLKEFIDGIENPRSGSESGVDEMELDLIAVFQYF